MRSALALVLFGATMAAASALPEGNGWVVRTAAEVEEENLPIVDLVITDERFEGKTFAGTVESIYAEMKELKPELFVNETTFEEAEESLSLTKRQSVNCGWYNNINDRVTWNACIDGLTYLMNLGTSWCGVNGSPACARVSCSHGCGIFLCNKLGHHLQVHCGDIPRDVNAIGSACMQSYGAFSGARDFSSHFIGVRKQSC